MTLYFCDIRPVISQQQTHTHQQKHLSNKIIKENSSIIIYNRVMQLSYFSNILCAFSVRVGGVQNPAALTTFENTYNWP